MDVTPGRRNLLTDVPGLSVGHAADPGRQTGVTVCLGDAPMTAAVHVMGGAPGTRETDLLSPENTVEAVDALVLSGGSAFGLAAADGVMSTLAEQGRGFEVAGHRVPIVPAAILFDLATGNSGVSPDYPALGRKAVSGAESDFAIGSVGAGTGATTADLKGGLGSASVVTPSGTTVGALVAVNAVGSVIADDTGRFFAAPFEIGDEFGGLGIARSPAPPVPPVKFAPGAATTIAIVATDAILTKAQAKRMAVAAHDGLARAILPSHTPLDGDLVFAVSTGRRQIDEAEIWMLGHHAATCLARAVARGVWAAQAAPGDTRPTWSSRFG